MVESKRMTFSSQPSFRGAPIQQGPQQGPQQGAQQGPHWHQTLQDPRGLPGTPGFSHSW